MKLRIICLLLLSCLFTVSCSDEEDGSAYDFGKPVKISTFMPDSGGVREKFVIKGENFGTDISKIKVYFNKMKAHVQSSSGSSIYALVPRQPGDTCDITLVIGDESHSDSVVFEGKQFKYIIQASVSTVVGKEDVNGAGGYVDGAYAEAMFDDPRGIGVDKDGSLLITETNPLRVRLAVENQVSTLMTNVPDYPLSINFEPNREVAYFPLNTSADFMIFRMEKKKGYLPVKIVHLKKADYPNFHYVAGVVPDGDANLYVFGRKDGAIVRFTPPTYKMDTIGYIPQGGIGGAYGVYNYHDKKLYWACQNGNAIFRINLDGSGVETFAGKFNSLGSQDGLGEQARFNSPCGIDVDSRGNLYVCDSKNHTVRMIDPEGLVTTLAGRPGQAGLNDGPPDEAKFDGLVGLSVDRNDFIYVGDVNNSRIRKIAIE